MYVIISSNYSGIDKLLVIAGNVGHYLYLQTVGYVSLETVCFALNTVLIVMHLRRHYKRRNIIKKMGQTKVVCLFVSYYKTSISALLLSCKQFFSVCIQGYQSSLSTCTNRSLHESVIVTAEN